MVILKCTKCESLTGKPVGLFALSGVQAGISPFWRIYGAGALLIACGIYSSGWRGLGDVHGHINVLRKAVILC